MKKCTLSNLLRKEVLFSLLLNGKNWNQWPSIGSKEDSKYLTIKKFHKIVCENRLTLSDFTCASFRSLLWSPNETWRIIGLRNSMNGMHLHSSGCSNWIWETFWLNWVRHNTCQTNQPFRMSSQNVFHMSKCIMLALSKSPFSSFLSMLLRMSSIKQWKILARGSCRPTVSLIHPQGQEHIGVVLCYQNIQRLHGMEYPRRYTVTSYLAPK